MAESSPQIPTGVPTAARVYDVMLGGKDNYEVDRAVAAGSLAIMPELRDIALHNRAILHRVVRHLAAEEGITQFLDLGSGLPTVRNTHEVAQEVNPAAHVVYVDIDPIVLAHGRAILADNANTTVVTADIRRPDDLLERPEVRALIDFDKPVCVMLVGILHHLADDEKPGQIVQVLRTRCPAAPSSSSPTSPAWATPPSRSRWKGSSWSSSAPAASAPPPSWPPSSTASRSCRPASSRSRCGARTSPSSTRAPSTSAS